MPVCDQVYARVGLRRTVKFWTHGEWPQKVKNTPRGGISTTQKNAGQMVRGRCFFRIWTLGGPKTSPKRVPTAVRNCSASGPGHSRSHFLTLAEPMRTIILQVGQNSSTSRGPRANVKERSRLVQQGSKKSQKVVSRVARATRGANSGGFGGPCLTLCRPSSEGPNSGKNALGTFAERFSGSSTLHPEFYS